jgi:uncharacterized membrane protein SpoIIM required for sporulation
VTREARRPDPARAPREPRADLARLEYLLARAQRPPREEALELARLQRRASTLVARLESRGEDPELAARARDLVARAHAFLERPGLPARGRPLALVWELFLERAPRTIRGEWRLLLASFALLYGLAGVAWLAVASDLDLAYSLLPQSVVENELRQLAATAQSEPFRGNFQFGLGASPILSGYVMLHNMGVGILFFASALVPPLYFYLLAQNGLMLGAYTAVAGHWGQASAISSILWCHGVIEIQALVLAGTAGLVLVRAWIRPGARSRSHALVAESGRALLLLAPVFPMLFAAGLIEGFVSPHAPLAARLAVAIASGALLLAWGLLGGRGRASPGDSGRRAAPGSAPSLPPRARIH